MGQERGELDAAKGEVEAILASGVLNSSSRQAKLLEYLFDKLAHGHAEEVKEYTIAVELFQKTANFDQHSDATVRVEAHRLRRKLQHYYETAGRDHEWRLLLPAGQYRLQLENTHQAAVAIPGARGARVRGIAEASRGKRWLAFPLAGVAILAVIACVWLYRISRSNSDPAKKEVHVSAQTVRDTVPDPEPGAIRILAGYTGDPFTDNSGRLWQSDRYFEGGSSREVRHLVGRTSRPRLFQHAREGSFHYRIPLAAGEYELQLYFTLPDDPQDERSPQREFRIMIVNANGRQLLAPFHLDADAGLNADVRAFAPVKPNNDGVLDLQFWSARGPASVCAVEVWPLVNGRIRPIRITARPRPYEDTQGRLWLPDDYYSGGKLGGYQAMIAGGDDPGIYRDDHMGDVEYFIPVPPSKYEVRLYFAEGWWGSGDRGGSVGTRVFDVVLNYETVLRGFDMLRESPPGQLIVRSFKHVVPDRYGKIHLTFSARADYASIRAIEVLPEETPPL